MTQGNPQDTSRSGPQAVRSLRPGREAAPRLRAEGLAVGYRAVRNAAGRAEDRRVLSDLDLELQPGELVCLLGPNGAGKSTLLRTLAGLQAPLAGRILIDGEDIAALAQDARARKTAIVLTERMEAGNLTVHALAALARHPHTGWMGRLMESDWAAVRLGLEAAGAWELRERLFDELSDGEKQRVMLARALAQEPALLLLDEPTAFLDLPRRVETIRILRKLAHDHGRAVLLSTHDLDLAMRAADRLWLLEPGGPMRCGLPEDLALSGAIGTVFDQGDVAFDISSGQFRIHAHPEKHLALSGDPLLVMWTTRVLEREGYGIAGSGQVDAPSAILAEFRDGRPSWRFSGPASASDPGSGAPPAQTSGPATEQSAPTLVSFATLEALAAHLRDFYLP
jgi:iron complex transport system ATP-binding protein